MAYLIGTDEAGYGPKLGPLVISVSVWHVPAVTEEVNLYERLSSCVSSGAARDGQHTSIVDSKLLYRVKGELARLEEGVLAALAASGQAVDVWRTLWQTLAPECVKDINALPWHEGFDRPLPLGVDQSRLAALTTALDEGLQTARVRLVKLKARVLFPRSFNQEVGRCGNKATALTEATLRLIRDVLPAASESNEPVFIVCDKHGGRSYYAAALQQEFSDELIQVVHESAAESLYRWGTGRRSVKIRFQAKGESHLPSALASMLSKYLRELAMIPFNEYWNRRCPGIRPTAGYPQDANRFLQEIQTNLDELTLAPDDYWRCK